jgi:hypothetical protein
MEPPGCPVEHLAGETQPLVGFEFGNQSITGGRAFDALVFVISPSDEGTGCRDSELFKVICRARISEPREAGECSNGYHGTFRDYKIGDKSCQGPLFDSLPIVDEYGDRSESRFRMMGDCTIPLSSGKSPHPYLAVRQGREETVAEVGGFLVLWLVMLKYSPRNAYLVPRGGRGCW